jgi:hypothetical protein
MLGASWVVSLPKRYGIYFAACLLAALAYALLTGRQPLVDRLLDGAVYGVELLGGGVALRNVFRYAFPTGSRLLFSRIFTLVLAVLTTVLVVGIESLIAFLSFPSRFADFAETIPLRLFITLLFFVIARLALHPAAGGTVAEASSAAPTPLPAPLERISVRNGPKIKIIPIDEIHYVQADGDYVAIHTAEGHWLKEQTMKSMEALLPPDRFVRIHRSCIVNIMRISRIERHGERQQVILHRGEKIKVSAARYQMLKQRLGLCVICFWGPLLMHCDDFIRAFVA